MLCAVLHTHCGCVTPVYLLLQESEDENPLSKAMLKPVFVPKSKRGTVKERELAEAEYWAQEEKKQQQLVERKKDSQQLLVDTVCMQ